MTSCRAHALEDLEPVHAHLVPEIAGEAGHDFGNGPALMELSEPVRAKDRGPVTEVW